MHSDAIRAAAMAAALWCAGSGDGAAAQDAAARGREIADLWCAECHVASEGQASATDLAPSFETIAVARGRSAAWLRGWLADPHPPMPNPGLSRAQIDAVIAYLQTLRP